jgi:hypothetical protein
VDDPVQEAVLQEELAGLEALRELDADGLGDDLRAGEADQGLGLGQDDVAEEAKLAATPPMVGWVRTLM